MVDPRRKWGFLQECGTGPQAGRGKRALGDFEVPQLRDMHIWADGSHGASRGLISGKTSDLERKGPGFDSRPAPTLFASTRCRGCPGQRTTIIPPKMKSSRGVLPVAHRCPSGGAHGRTNGSRFPWSDLQKTKRTDQDSNLGPQGARQLLYRLYHGAHGVYKPFDDRD